MRPAVRVSIVGCGLIGASIALALREAGFSGEIAGFDKSAADRAAAERLGAFTSVRLVQTSEDDARSIAEADIVVLATPVLAVLDWMERLAPCTRAGGLVTDVGSTKRVISEQAAALFASDANADFLPGHPMAGKESGGAAMAEAGLFRGATWLFTPLHPVVPGTRAAEWIDWIERLGARPRFMDPAAHDDVCAWVSHLPQMLSTALAALLEDTFAGDPAGSDAVQAIGGRALRETTRLGASPYSMWRDVALTNTEPLAATLLALEQRLQHMRENLRTPELREEFATANRFRAAKPER